MIASLINGINKIPIRALGHCSCFSVRRSNKSRSIGYHKANQKLRNKPMF
jgi:hypothetical protein